MILASACAAAVLPACTPKQAPMKEQPIAEAHDATAVEAAQNIGVLEDVAFSLEQKAHALPGQGAAAHRDAMRDVFGDIAQALTILEGPEPSDALRLQVRSIESSRGRLSSDAAVSTIEPAIGTGLRAADVALKRLSHDDTYADAALDETLKHLGATVDELDTVRPVGRPYIAADASKLIARAVRQMADKSTVPTTQVPTNENATTGPATSPAEPPATQTAEPLPAEAAATALAPEAEKPDETVPAEASAEPAAPEGEMPAEPAAEQPAAATEEPQESPAAGQSAEPNPDEPTPAEATEAPKTDAAPKPADDLNK